MSRRPPDEVLYLPCARLPPGSLLCRYRGRTHMGVAQGFVMYGDGQFFGWDALPGQRLSGFSVCVVQTSGVIAGFAYDVLPSRKRIWHYDANGILISMRVLKARGTWVHPHYRKHGLGTLLWETALSWERPAAVDVRVITDKGRTLAEALKAAHPAIRWEITEGGKRKLRQLKTA